MKKIRSLLLIAIALVSISSLAAGVKDNRPLLQFRGIDGDFSEIGMNVDEQYIQFGTTPHHHESGNVLSNVSLLIETQRLPMLGTIPGDTNFTVRNKVTLTYRASDQTTYGAVREGPHGNGLGFEHETDRRTRFTVWGAFFRDHKVMAGIKFLLR